MSAEPDWLLDAPALDELDPIGPVDELDPIGPVDEAIRAEVAQLAPIVALPAWAIEAAADLDDPPSIGTRTAADLSFGPPPPQLVGEHYLTPEDATVGYGPGGTGKTTWACWLAAQLVAAGHVLEVLDFEGHEREWGSRLRGLGLPVEQLAQIHYRAPFAVDWSAPSGALARVADLVREDAKRVGATYLMVDSYSQATSGGDAMGGEEAAKDYFAALQRIGLPSLTIAHVKGDAGRFPDRPFGSVHVHNRARETWSIERVAGADDPDVGDAEPYAPKVVALELRNKKANGRAKSPAQFLTFTYYADGSIEASTDRHGRPTADLVADVLNDAPLTLPAIRKAIAEDTEQDVSIAAIRKALSRDPRRFVIASTKRPHTWTLR